MKRILFVTTLLLASCAVPPPEKPKKEWETWDEIVKRGNEEGCRRDPATRILYCSAEKPRPKQTPPIIELAGRPFSWP